jgi:hypothetical protein
VHKQPGHGDALVVEGSLQKMFGLLHRKRFTAYHSMTIGQSMSHTLVIPLSCRFEQESGAAT